MNTKKDALSTSAYSSSMPFGEFVQNKKNEKE